MTAQSLPEPARAVEWASVPNYRHLLVLDFNNDGINDFVLTGEHSKYFIVQRSLKNKNISPPIKKFFFFPIAEIKKFNTRNVWGDFYIAVSSAKKLAALVSFTNFGTLQLLNTRSFKSSPSHLLVADIDSSGKKQAIVFGANFDGIDVIKEKNFILRSKKYLRGEPISTADFIDVNYDGYPDIAAYNALTGKLKLLINNQTGGFNFLRSINIGGDINYLKSSDFNNDGFEDIALLQNDEFKILLGDSVSSFKNKVILDLNFKAKKFFILSSKNNDFKQLLFLTQNNCNLYSLTIKGHSYSQRPKPFILGRNIEDVFEATDSLNNVEIYLYSNKGRIFKILKNANFPQEFVYLTGNNVSGLFFHHSPFLIVSSDSSQIEETIVRRAGNLMLKEKLPLPYLFKTLLPLFSKRTIRFVQYSQGDSLLHFVSIGKDGGKTNSQYFDLKNKIADVEWLKALSKKYFLTAICVDSAGNYFTRNFNLINQTLKPNYDTILKFSKATSVKSKTEKSKAFYWEINEGKLLLEKKYSNGKIITRRIVNSKNASRNSLIISIPNGFSVANAPENAILIEDGKIRIKNKNKISPTHKIGRKLLGLLKSVGTIKGVYANGSSYFVASPGIGKGLILLSYSWVDNKFKIKKTIESFNSNTYFVTRFKKNKVYLVYLDNEEKIIKFKEISAN